MKFRSVMMAMMTAILSGGLTLPAVSQAVTGCSARLLAKDEAARINVRTGPFYAAVGMVWPFSAIDRAYSGSQ